jgi:hypothetical protein
MVREETTQGEAYSLTVGGHPKANYALFGILTVLIKTKNAYQATKG